MLNVTTLNQLAQIKAGETFVLRGMVHKAREDVRDTNNRFTGERTVYVRGLRANPAMPSGWELCDMIEHPRSLPDD